MTSALDTFEQSLVAASRALRTPSPETPPDGGPSRRTVWPRRLLRRLRSLGALAQAGIALGALSGCAGVAVAAYLLLAGAQARMLPEFECEVASSDAAIQAVTGSPIVDCATIWPSASGGRQSAPRLAIWGVTTGQKLVALVRDARLGPPPAAHGQRWARLPDSWTADLRVVALNDQLSNIDQPFTLLPQPKCSYAAADVAAVRSLLRSDGLLGWKVQVRGSKGQGSNTCRPTIADVDGPNRKVLLVQLGGHDGLGSSGQTQALDRSVMHVYRQLSGLYRDVNRQLNARCQSVAAAARLWTRVAGAAGYTPTTLAFWRELNDGARRPGAIAKRYTLYLQPSAQRTGRCAHVLVIGVPGDGFPNVYVARIRP